MKLNIVVNPSFRHLDSLITAIARDGVPADATLIYKGRNKVYRLDRDGLSLVVKAFHDPRGINAWVYTNLRDSKAKRSYDNASRLIAMGFDSPRPVAYTEATRRGRLTHSYYISLFFPSSDLRHCELKPDASALLRALASEMKRLHDAGVLNKDFSPGNVLYTGDPAAGYRFSYVDVNRMAFGVTDRRRLMANFRALSLNRRQLAELAGYYAEATGADREATVDEALRRLDGFERARKRKEPFKSALRRLGLHR